MRRTLAVAALMTTALCAQSGPGLAGHWEGAIQAPDGDLQVQIDLAQENGKGWMGTISIPAQNAKGMRLIDVVVKENAVTFGIKAPGDPLFHGTVAKERGNMSGEVTQGGTSMPFQLARTGEAMIEKAVANPLLSKELEGTWEGALEAGGQTLRLRFVLSNESGAGTGKLISVDQGNAEIPIIRISQAGLRVKLESPMINASFEGDLKESRMNGEWSQGGGSLPLTLTKSTK